MLIGVIADDFTGASDIANTLAKGRPGEHGLSTAQFAGVPFGVVPAHVEAGVISLKTRSAPVKEAVEQSLQALRWLMAQGCRQYVFKYCSTFDSTETGNIGPVADALAEALGVKAVVVCPAFPATGRTLYQGHLFVFDKLLSNSGMENHPLTPMREPDIRRCMASQSVGAVGHVPLSTVKAGDESISYALRQLEAEDKRFAVVDAVADEDLLTIASALDGVPLVTGGSGIAMGLPHNFIRAGLSKSSDQQFDPIAGAEAIMAGSCSGATRAQIEHHALKHPVFAIDVAKVMADELTVNELLDFYHQHVGDLPLVYSSGAPEEVKEIQRVFGREAVSAKLDGLFSALAVSLHQQGFRRLVVAGGETSGAVAQALSAALGEDAMLIGPEIAPGVPILSIGDKDPVALALKSGNFGGEDFFAKALAMMEGER